MAQQRRQPLSRVLRSVHLRSPGRVLLVVALLCLFLGTQGQTINPTRRAIHLACDLLHLRSEHARIVKENDELARAVAYLRTDEGQELAARSELGAVRRGERLIICSSPQETSSVASTPLFQLVHNSLVKGYEACDGAGQYLAELPRCLWGATDTTGIPAPEDGGEEGYVP